jgi:glycosyltransferase involved in cell wall biosynthesis
MTSEMIDHRFLRPDSVFYRPLRWLEERIDHCPDAVITSSTNAARLLQEEFHCRPDRVWTVTDCVDSSLFRPDALSADGKARLRARYKIPADAPLVVYVGILQDYQGIPQLIRSAQIVLQERPDVYFFIGGFPNENRYRTLARSLGVDHRVLLPGRVPYRDTPAHLSLGTVGAAPKLSATEGAGKILNYMATGLPVVAFDTPVSREYLGELGLCAEPGSVRELAEQILTLVNRPDEAHKRGQRLRARAAERYTWTQGGQRITEIYQEVCPQPRTVL